VILVTELIRWGRSARFVARSYRGRDIHCWMPPAQIPAGVIHAPYVLEHIRCEMWSSQLCSVWVRKPRPVRAKRVGSAS
jgi:hypothetical protein